MATWAMIFPTFFAIQFGMLNLILTVIVDRASDARAEDHERQLVEKQKDFDRAASKLAAMCEHLDEDGDGHLTLEELHRGFDDLQHFADFLKIMDVDRSQIETVFEILDTDGNGTVTYTEFVEELHKMKHQETHTLLIFIKHFNTQILKKVTEQVELVRQQQEEQMRKLRKTVRGHLSSFPLITSPSSSRGDGSEEGSPEDYVSRVQSLLLPPRAPSGRSSKQKLSCASEANDYSLKKRSRDGSSVMQASKRDGSEQAKRRVYLT
eukprot:TRINITY_DN12450_c0_g2_i2.p1 TRINITY_DN12450_c0_g2~~TRINITY_DN12450_c0_g2_i2.p1  ORF type:complete len:280 (-),score=47.30 TRINITY_DN12450_c0_g2_i2:780-1574(-)